MSVRPAFACCAALVDTGRFTESVYPAMYAAPVVSTATLTPTSSPDPPKRVVLRRRLSWDPARTGTCPVFPHEPELRRIRRENARRRGTGHVDHSPAVHGKAAGDILDRDRRYSWNTGSDREACRSRSQRHRRRHRPVRFDIRREPESRPKLSSRQPTTSLTDPARFRSVVITSAAKILENRRSGPSAEIFDAKRIEVARRSRRATVAAAVAVPRNRSFEWESRASS